MPECDRRNKCVLLCVPVHTRQPTLITELKQRHCTSSATLLQLIMCSLNAKLTTAVSK